jgi:uncharacterized protein (TIGR02145 family)
MKTSFSSEGYLVIAGLLIFSLSWACKKEHPSSTLAPTSDVLTEMQLTLLESLPDTFVQLEDMILENGVDVRSYLESNDPDFLISFPSGRIGETTESHLSRQEQKLLLMARVSTVGNYLVWDENHQHDSIAPDSPAQNGLAYSFGSRDHSIRQVPSFGDCRDKKIFGLDCSGMLYTMLSISELTGIEPPANFTVATTRDTGKWNRALRNSIYDSLKVIDKGQLPLSDIRFGDIIYWTSHVGWSIGNCIYQSYGRGGLPGCRNNLQADKGPRMLPLNQDWMNEFGAYRVYRITYQDEESSVTDVDGNEYPVVTIGTQKWMAENLRTSRYHDGSAIPNVTDDDSWNMLTTGARCNYNNNSGLDEQYGKLYNWYSVADSRLLCPAGWHVPADTEWTKLTDFLGGASVAGGKMKAIQGWTEPNTGATNESGFTALPAGGRYPFASEPFKYLGRDGYWWSSTPSQSNQSNAFSRGIDYSAKYVGRGNDNKLAGLSVRCVKD